MTDEMKKAEEERVRLLRSAHTDIRYENLRKYRGRTGGTFLTDVGLNDAIKRLIIGSHAGRIGA